MTALFKNNAFSTLDSGISDVATSIALSSGDGAKFPSPTGTEYFYATLIDTSNNLEIVKCTSRSTDTLTVVREQEGTTKRAYSAGDRIEMRLTAAGLTANTDLAKDYATKVDGVVTGSDYSSNAWAVGGTGVTDTASRGAAKEWATEAEDNTVDGSGYSALHWAAKAAASSTAATASQTAAAASQTAAAASAAAAAASADSFDDVYLGSKSSDPTVDNDGDALTEGDLYWNSSTKALKVYDG